ncbi:MAG: hypothetical protein Fur0032_23450 [Terrimicrobiaceae bacterium]
MNLPYQNHLPRRAFSLVEVAMSLGIFSFAMMGLLGLIPAAVIAHRDAKLDTVLAQIKQRLAAEVLLTDGNALAALNNFDRAFDAEGIEIMPGSPNADARTVYRGKIMIETFTPPGAAGQSQSLQRILLYAVQDPTSGKTILNAAQPSGSLLIPKAESAGNSASL